MFNIDWAGIFMPETPLLEIFIRGTLTYLGLFILLRVVMKRESGMVGISDLLVVVLLADAAQNAMADDYRSVTDGMLLIATIIFWSYVLDWLGYRFPRIHRMLRPPPLLLIKDGKMIRRNMRKEFITEDDLHSLLREQGVDDVGKVKEAYIEGDGAVSVIERKEEHHPKDEHDKAV